MKHTVFVPNVRGIVKIKNVIVALVATSSTLELTFRVSWVDDGLNIVVICNTGNVQSDNFEVEARRVVRASMDKWEK